MANNPSSSAPRQPHRQSAARDAPDGGRGGAGSSSSAGGGMGVRSEKGGGAPGPDVMDRPPRPARDATNVTGEDPRGPGANATGTNPGFTESQTKDLELAGGDGLVGASQRGLDEEESQA